MSDKGSPFPIDELGQPDWLRSMHWDIWTPDFDHLVGTLDELFAVIGGPEKLADFLKLDAAKAMPAELKADVDQFLAGTDHRSPSGVLILANFRNNLIIDRYDPVFLTMRGDKTDNLRSENSEDALTWNVFRSLRQISPSVWFPSLFARAFPDTPDTPPHKMVSVNLWPRIAPPPSIRLRQKDEGDSEIDILIETEQAVWFIEAKYKSDVSLRTTNNPKRDQVIRNLDVGSWYAGSRNFYFSLLFLDEARSPLGTSLVREYAATKDQVLERLPHRSDGLMNLRGLGLLTWRQVAAILGDCAESAPREDERPFAAKAAKWLERKSILPGC